MKKKKFRVKNWVWADGGECRERDGGFEGCAQVAGHYKPLV